MAELMIPQSRFYAGFRSAEIECRREGRRLLAALDVLSEPMDAVLRFYSDLHVGRNLPPHLVPATELWLIADGAFVGRVSIRHDLNDYLRSFGGHIGYVIRPTARRRGYGKAILKLAIPEARKLGIERALVTCDKTNLASRKIIEANGGVFESEVDQGPNLPSKMRYWIDTSIGKS
jgi:predicted acetyltransferase